MPNAYTALDGIERRHIVITGLQLETLEDLSIHHEPNTQAVAVVSGTMKDEAAAKLLQQSEMDPVKIEAVKAEDKKQVLFYGNITDIFSRKAEEGTFVSVTLMDTSVQLTLQRGSQSFQTLTKKYADVLKAVCGEQVTIQFSESVKDKPIDKLVLRLDETPWDFALRMASRFQASLFSDLTAEKPMIYFGLRKSGQNISLVGWNIEKFMADMAYQKMSKGKLAEGVKVVREDFASSSVYTGTYVYLGDEVTVNDKKYFVRSVQASFVRGILQMSYGLAVSANSFLTSIASHPNCEGQLLRAQVKKAEKDRVQVHFVDIDEKYDEGSTAWLPFATVYSSKDGSGWYAMPEVGDYVRVMFPSREESDAFAASTINMTPMAKTTDKSFRAPGGREILLTEKGIEIICDHQKIFVDLSMEKGISLVSSKDIKVSADGNISLDAKGSVQIASGKEIEMKVGSSHVKVASDQITLGSGKVVVGG